MRNRGKGHFFSDSFKGVRKEVTTSEINRKYVCIYIYIYTISNPTAVSF